MIIYKAANKINGKVYIGQTSNNLRERINKHNRASKYYNHKSTPFHNAIRKYGENNFTWEILCKTDSESKLNALEKFYIATYRKIVKVYNITDGGYGIPGFKHSELTKTNHSKNIMGKRNPFYGKKHSIETKLKISQSRKGKCIGEDNPMYGKSRSGEDSPNYKRKFSKKWCDNISKSKIGENNPFYGRKHTEETKKKMRESKIKRDMMKQTAVNR